MTSLWRLRKRNHCVDAQLEETSRRVKLRFAYDGRAVFAREWRTRRSALAHASKKRRELERAGWVEHW